jgi:hypothetical protein
MKVESEKTIIYLLDENATLKARARIEKQTTKIMILIASVAISYAAFVKMGIF